MGICLSVCLHLHGVLAQEGQALGNERWGAQVLVLHIDSTAQYSTDTAHDMITLSTVWHIE